MFTTFPQLWVFGKSGGNGLSVARRPELEPALLPRLLLPAMENQLRRLHAPQSRLINQLAQMQQVQVAG